MIICIVSPSDFFGISFKVLSIYTMSFFYLTSTLELHTPHRTNLWKVYRNNFNIQHLYLSPFCCAEYAASVVIEYVLIWPLYFYFIFILISRVLLNIMHYSGKILFLIISKEIWFNNINVDHPAWSRLVDETNFLFPLSESWGILILVNGRRLVDSNFVAYRKRGNPL